ncbi:GGDEF domain-containing protein [soil metagenome]
MRYTEPKERSAELLRVALGHMGRHYAALNPFTFTVWYEHAAGINAKLSQAIEQALALGKRFDDAIIALLYKTHIAHADESTLQRLSGRFDKVMDEVAECATLTGTQAGVFGVQLDGLSLALQAHDVPELSPRVNEALAGTAEMKLSAEALQLQVTASRVEIDRLRSDLNTARDEAVLDPLAGVLNRKGFDQKLRALLAEAHEPASPHCLIMFDIDHFKKVNDTHGHVMGDRVIRALGDILRSCVADHAGDHAKQGAATAASNATNASAHAVARYGGEEFAILLPRTSVEHGTRLAEAVRNKTKAIKIRNRTTQEVILTITISGGVAAMQDGDDAPSFIARADRALYRAKQAGRDRVSCA